MNTKRTLRFSDEPTFGSRGPKKGEKEVKRQDWGFTEQYRRMMQRDTRKKADLEETE